MAPRKHTDEKEKEVDPSQITWRIFMTSFNALIVAITAWIAAHMGTSNDTTGLQRSVDRLASSVEAVQVDVKTMGRRMEMVEANQNSMSKRVDALQSAVDGALKGMHL